MYETKAIHLLFSLPSSLLFFVRFHTLPASWRLWGCLLSSAGRDCGGRGLPQIVHCPAHMGECSDDVMANTMWWAGSSSDCSLPNPHGWVCSDDVMANTMHSKPMEAVTSYQLWSTGRCWENPRSFWLLFWRNLDSLHSRQAQTWVRDGSSS